MTGTLQVDLTAARHQLDRLVLPEVCEIMRRPAPGAPWGTVAADVPCRYSPHAGRDVDAASDIAAAVDADATIRLPADTDARRGDRLRVTGEAGSVLADVLWTAPMVRVHKNVLVRTVESA